MAKKITPLQQIVRGTIREIINEVNSSKPKPTKTLKQKFPKRQRSNKKRSRYISNAIRVDVLNRDNYRCVFCGRTAKQIELQIDHIIPFSQNGTNDMSNLQTLCIDCNLGKSDRFI